MTSSDYGGIRWTLVPTLVVALGASLGSQSEERPAFWRLVIRASDSAGLSAPVDEVLEHVASVVDRRNHVPNRLALVNQSLMKPWSVPETAQRMRDGLSLPLSQRRFVEVSSLESCLQELLEIDQPSTAEDLLLELDGLWRELDSEQLVGVALLETLSEYVGLAHLGLDIALDGIDEQAIKLLFENHRDFCEAWYQSHFPNQELSAEQSQVLEQYQQQLLQNPQHDRALCSAIFGYLLRLVDSAFVQQLARRVATVDQQSNTTDYGKDVIAVAGEAPHNRVLLCGRRQTVHDKPAALILDLGGDDIYQRAAVVDDRSQLVSVVIDLKGHELYESSAPGPAYAAGGVAILCDWRGNDQYRSKRLGQGASALGHALLLDFDGDDRYAMQDYGQGHALCGVGLLYDVEGADQYEAWAFAQGGGIGYGMSALVDGDGRSILGRFALAGRLRQLGRGNLSWGIARVLHWAATGHCWWVRRAVGSRSRR